MMSRFDKNKNEVYYSKITSLERHYILPWTITKLFSPLPPLLRKDYILFLFFNEINPYEIYKKTDHEKIDKVHFEYIEIKDKFQSHLEFNVFPEISLEIKNKNEHLYNLLSEKNSLQNIQGKIEKTRTAKKYNEISEFKNKKFGTLFQNSITTQELNEEVIEE